uniref:ABC transporter family protein n=1 Tax=Babesia bovis TaxID=5865 RepID=S6C9G5_BABBO|nr:ABC transporter family protein [Babesia bovis]
MLYSDDEIISALECCGLLDMVKTLHPTRFLDAVLVDENLKIARGLYVVIPIICLKQVKEEGFTVETKKTKAKVSGKDQSGPCFTSSQLRMLTLSRLFLYRNHYRLLLIDEPPSENCGENDAQDGENVDVVPDKCIPVYDLVDLYFKHCTTFIVAHDLRALRSCNQIWFMESGEITRKIMGASNVAEYLNNL